MASRVDVIECAIGLLSFGSAAPALEAFGAIADDALQIIEKDIIELRVVFKLT